MANFRRMAWCAAATLAVIGGEAAAQQNGQIGTPSTQTSSTISSNGATTTTSIPTSSGNTNTNASSSGQSLNIPGATSNIAGNQQAQTFELATLNQAPSKTQTNNTAINTSNFLRNYYGSVYYQGSDPKQTPNRNPGSFGTAIYAATGTTAGGRGAQGQQGAARGTAGSLTDAGGQIVQLPRQIAYASQIQFKMPAGNPVPQLQNELQTSISRVSTDMLANPAAVQVAVDGRNVTLKGSVRDEEELRFVEGIVRLTPGVFGIKNELTIVK